MNKLLLVIVGVIILGGGAAFLITRGNSNNSVKVTNTATGQSQDIKTGATVLVAVDACTVLTDSVAKQILGDGAVKGNTAAGNAASNDVSVSNCVYTVQIDPNVVKPKNSKGVSVLARAAKTQVGADTNKAQFGGAKPAGVQDVSGIGDAAFFNPKFGQLDVLKGGNWYILSNYVGDAMSGTVESNTQLANLLSFQ